MQMQQSCLKTTVYIFTLIVMMPLQVELSQSSSNSWHVRQTCQLALNNNRDYDIIEVLNS